jgi:hypothetical protein
VKLGDTRERARRLIIGFGVVVFIAAVIGIVASRHDKYELSKVRDLPSTSPARLSYKLVRAGDSVTYVITGYTFPAGINIFDPSAYLPARSGVKPGDKVQCPSPPVIRVVPEFGQVTEMGDGEAFMAP